jgi:hypothetical protein
LRFCTGILFCMGIGIIISALSSWLRVTRVLWDADLENAWFVFKGST